MMIETLSGMPYQDFIRRRIFEPLEMTSSGYLSRDHIIPRLASGYQVQDGAASYPPAVSPTLIYSAGAIRSTVEDLARWDAALRRTRLLDHATQARMEQPLTLNDGPREGYGLGWGLSKSPRAPRGPSRGRCARIFGVPRPLRRGRPHDHHPLELGAFSTRRSAGAPNRQSVTRPARAIRANVSSGLSKPASWRAWLAPTPLCSASRSMLTLDGGVLRVPQEN